MNEEQVDIWSGRSGNAWVDLQPVLDRVFQAIEELLVASVPAGSPCRVLDVGCGTGATTLAVAARLGVGGRALGVDLSPPMTEAARARAERAGSLASFVCADAQTYAFEAASFDVILSRFGVMFFDDPIQAFANLRRAARADGELYFVVWRSPEGERSGRRSSRRCDVPSTPTCTAPRFASTRPVGESVPAPPAESSAPISRATRGASLAALAARPRARWVKTSGGSRGTPRQRPSSKRTGSALGAREHPAAHRAIGAIGVGRFFS